jgi:hypothetical protein
MWVLRNNGAGATTAQLARGANGTATRYKERGERELSSSRILRSLSLRPNRLGTDHAEKASAESEWR